MTLASSIVRSRTLALVLTAVATAACSEAPTQSGAGIHQPNAGALADVTPATLDGSNAASGQLGTFTDKLNLQIPTGFHAQNPCAGGRFGEIVVFTGNQHLVFSQASTANGHLSMMVHWNADDVIGIGQYTGFQYRATGVTQDHVVSNVTLPYTETTTNNYHIIGQGQATNMDLKETVHVTVDANGDVTAWVTDYNFVCHGTETF
jgi:hypothetical protein